MLLTAAFSLDELVLSRVFGTVVTPSERLDGSQELRRTVESITRVPSSRKDPAAFSSLVATTLTDRADGLVAIGDDTDRDPPAEFTSAPGDVAATGRVSTSTSRRTRRWGASSLSASGPSTR